MQGLQVLIFIPVGIVMGYIMYKIKSQFFGYIFAIFPYLTFFLLSIQDREEWGHYRAVAFLALAVSCLVCFTLRKLTGWKASLSSSFCHYEKFIIYKWSSYWSSTSAMSHDFSE